MSALLGKRKIFVSYKYKDANVFQLPNVTPGPDTGYMVTPRHYVDIIIDLMGSDHVYKGEKSNEDASHLADLTIQSKLRDKLFDTSITLVLLSPNMWEKSKPQNEQWIPNEIYYSLLNKSRGERTSKSNALLLVALPDAYGSYDHAVINKACGVTSWQTASLFHTIRSNMFNLKKQNTGNRDSCYSSHHYGGDHSFAHPVKWSDFVSNYNGLIDYVLMLRDRIADFDIQKVRGPAYE